MPENSSRKYDQVISYIEDEVGVSIPRNVKRSAIAEVEEPIASDGLPSNITAFGGAVQSAVDVADQIDKIQNILSGQTLTVTDDGNFTIVDSSGNTIEEPLDVSSSEVDININSQSLSPLTVTDDGNLSIATWDAGTLTVTDDGSLNIAGVISIQEDTPLDVSASTVTVQEANPVDTNVNSPPSTKTTENYAADIETDFTATLNVGDYSHVGVSVNTDTNTDILVERSWDQNTWFEVESASSAGKLNQNVQGASGTYYRVTITGTGTTGDTADVVLSAKSM